jgi:hypothetical protein
MIDETGSANTSVMVPGTGVSLELKDLSSIVAAELAAELSSPENIRKKFGITKAQWDVLRANPMFRGMVKDALKTFRGELAAGARITRKSEILLEDLLGDLYSIAKSETTPSSERINAVKQLAELSGRGKNSDPKQLQPQTGGFTLNIAFGGEKSISIAANGTLPNTEDAS